MCQIVYVLQDAEMTFYCDAGTGSAGEKGGGRGRISPPERGGNWPVDEGERGKAGTEIERASEKKGSFGYSGKADAGEVSSATVEPELRTLSCLVPAVTAKVTITSRHLFSGEGPLAAQALTFAPKTSLASPRNFLKNQTKGRAVRLQPENGHKRQPGQLGKEV